MPFSSEAADARIVTASYDGTVKIWPAARSPSSVGSMSQSMLTLPESRCEANFDNDGASDHSMMTAVFSKDRLWVLTAAYDGQTRLWCAKTGTCRLALLEGSIDPAYTAFFSPDESCILTAAASGHVRLFNASDGAMEWDLLAHHGVSCRCASFSPDGRRLATASSDGAVKLWRCSTAGAAPELERTLIAYKRWMNTVMFSSDAAVLLTASADWTARIWCVETGMLLRTFEGHTHFVRTAVFSPTSAHVLTSCFDRTAKLWDIASGLCVLTFQGHRNCLHSAAFSDDGSLVLTSSRDCTARVWFAATGECLRVLEGHRSYVAWASFERCRVDDNRPTVVWEEVWAACRGVANQLQNGTKSEAKYGRGSYFDTCVILQTHKDTVKIKWDYDGSESVISRDEVRSMASAFKADVGRRSWVCAALFGSISSFVAVGAILMSASWTSVGYTLG